MSGLPTITTSAPGKLFLIGEYAVLEGAPSVLTAVNRRARVTLYAASGDHWYFSAPNLEIDNLALGADGQPGPDLDAAVRDRLRVFEAVRATVAGYLDTPLPPLEVHIDTADFARDGYKLGLGSSGAVAAALTRALLAWADIHPEPAELARLAIAAHRAAQGGTGSGGDVATSVYGGIIGYIRDQAPEPLTWPTGLNGTAVVTGQGASTTELVARVYAYGEHSPQGFQSDMTRLAALAEHAADHLGQANRFLQLAREYFEALIALDHHAEAGIVSPRHHELHALAARHGAVFKSSGAGGGDVGLLFTTNYTDQTALRNDFASADADIIDLELGVDGVTLEQGHSAVAPAAQSATVDDRLS